MGKNDFLTPKAVSVINYAAALDSSMTSRTTYSACFTCLDAAYQNCLIDYR